MKIRLLSVGKPKLREACALHDRYALRIRRLGCAYESASVTEVRPGGRFSDDHVREREARSLLEQLDGKDCLVALDRAGEEWCSEELAGQLTRWATPRATFVVGGPLGLSDLLLERADAIWALSRLTLPHELARVWVAEQIYRALTLIRRVPYHK